MTPIIHFEDRAELIRVGKEWQHLLGLSEWFIDYDFKDLNEENETLSDATIEFTLGHNDSLHQNKTSYIKIAKPSPTAITPTTMCEEKTLVHELLHCRFIIPEAKNDGFSSMFIDLHYHPGIESTARALICSKYGLPLEWFDNTNKLEEVK